MIPGRAIKVRVGSKEHKGRQADRHMPPPPRTCARTHTLLTFFDQSVLEVQLDILTGSPVGGCYCLSFLFTFSKQCSPPTYMTHRDLFSVHLCCQLVKPSAGVCGTSVMFGCVVLLGEHISFALSI